jgi:hypothetical protein
MQQLTTLATRVADALRSFAYGPTGMPAKDRARWAQAGSLADVGELTAQWLEGRIASQPGYCGPVDTDELDAPGMTGILIRLNRVGVVTNSSQAGLIRTYKGRGPWVQHAAVAGFAHADAADQLRTLIAAVPGLVFTACERRRGPVAPVSFDGDHVFTDFGAPLPAADIAGTWVGYGVCQPAAVAQLVAATQFAIYDAEPGRNDVLWPALARAAAVLGQAGE